jgi:nucleoside-diphosphate-sugar epimerase
MGPIPQGGTVAVTGSAGFIGGWIVRLLLDKGYRVRACVRDASDEKKTGFLRAMPGYASGRLSLHSADLDKAGCFDEIFKGCQGVAHVSHVSTYDDQDYVQKVYDHIINSVNLSESVSRIVVTSSIAAVIGETDSQELVRRPVCDEDRYPDESNPNRSAKGGQGYSMGKVLLERVFSDAAEASGRWDAITCCPGDNIGPILAAHQKEAGPWQHNVETMLMGKYTENVIGAYRPWWTVDVRDSAEAHICMLESDEVRNGQRLIAWSTESRDVEDVCASIDRLLPELGFAGAEKIDPFPEQIKARKAEFKSIWGGCELHNERIRNTLGMEFRSLDTSIRDCVESLLSVGKVKPNLKPGYKPGL